jgi:hypothetical protein
MKILTGLAANTSPREVGLTDAELDQSLKFSNSTGGRP